MLKRFQFGQNDSTIAESALDNIEFTYQLALIYQKNIEFLFSGIKYFSFKIFICKLEYIGYYDVHLKYRETYLELTYKTLS